MVSQTAQKFSLRQGSIRAPSRAILPYDPGQSQNGPLTYARVVTGKMDPLLFVCCTQSDIKVSTLLTMAVIGCICDGIMD